MTETLAATRSPETMSAREGVQNQGGSKLQPIELQITQLARCIEQRKNSQKVETLESKFRDESLNRELSSLKNDLKNAKENLTPEEATLETFTENSERLFGPKIRDFQNFLTTIGANSASVNRFELTKNLFDHLIKQNVAEFVRIGSTGNYFLFADEVLKNPQLKAHFTILREFVCIRQTEEELKLAFLEDKSYLETRELKVNTAVIWEHAEPAGLGKIETKQNIQVEEKEQKATTQESQTTTVSEVLTQLPAQIAETPIEASIASEQDQKTEIAQPQTFVESQAQVVEARTPIEIVESLQKVLNTVRLSPVSKQRTVAEAWIPLFALTENWAMVEVLRGALKENSVDVEATIIKEIEILSSTQEVHVESTSSNQQEISSAVSSNLESTQASIENIEPKVTFSSLQEARQNAYESVELATAQSSRQQMQRVIDVPSAPSNLSQDQLIQNTDNPSNTTTEVNQNTNILDSGQRYKAFRAEILASTDSDSSLDFTPLEQLSNQTFEPINFQPPASAFPVSQPIFNSPLQPVPTVQQNQRIDPSVFDFRTFGNIEILPPTELQTLYSEPKVTQEFNPFSNLEVNALEFTPTIDYQYKIVPQLQQPSNDFRSFTQTAFVPPRVNPEVLSEPNVEPTSFDLLEPAAFVPPDVGSAETQEQAAQPSQEFAQPTMEFRPPVQAFQIPQGAANNIKPFARKASPASAEFDGGNGDSRARASAKTESAPEAVAS